ncbi:MAG: enoyl-CoA hydratase/isomerase family protein [Parafilimonas sp.]|nr:enoyl-CoA hydratase/isomerase family protein [Parafilimonas sp.]
MLHQLNDGYVKTETHQGITHIEFFHPQSNSLPGKILEELAKEIHVAGHDDDCKLIILRSAGDKAFCAGASFDELAAITNEKEGTKFFLGFANLINSIRKCSKFVIGRIHGKCVGGGVGLAAACDYSIALEGADIKLSELALGIGPFVVGPAIERKIGTAFFSQLSIDASSWHSADWAHRKGLFLELHHTQEGLDEAVQTLTTSLLHASSTAMAELKRVLWQGTQHWDTLLQERAAISGKLVLSDFTKNYINQFKTKQKAKS